MSFFQYLKDTRGELNHVAWPTRIQTIVFTILVIAVSILTSLYLGFFDYLFTNALGKVVERFPGSSAPAAEIMDVDTKPVPAEGSTNIPVDINSVLPAAE